MKTTGSDLSDVTAAPRPTQFSLAANYDPELVPALAAYPVDEVYGKFPTDGVSGGRPRYLATPLSEDDLRHYIRLLNHHGIAFNYLLNGACFGNLEWTRLNAPASGRTSGRMPSPWRVSRSIGIFDAWRLSDARFVAICN